MSAIITHWSYTKYSAYSKCPKSAKLKHQKVKVPGTFASNRGIEVHEAGDKYIKGAVKLKDIPEEYRCVAKEIKSFRKEHYVTEQLLGLDKQWRIVDQSKGYRPCWFWIKMDFFKNYGTVAHAGDWKTGRIYPDTHKDQAELSAIVMHALAPKANAFEFDIYYLDQDGENTNFFWGREDIPKLKRRWKQKTKAMLADAVCEATPGPQCNWCEYNVTKGGPCDEGS